MTNQIETTVTVNDDQKLFVIKCAAGLIEPEAIGCNIQPGIDSKIVYGGDMPEAF